MLLIFPLGHINSINIFLKIHFLNNNFIENPILGRKSTHAFTQIKNIMLKECAQIVIINLEEQRNHGSVIMINYMPKVYVKIVTLIDITRSNR